MEFVLQGKNEPVAGKLYRDLKDRKADLAAPVHPERSLNGRKDWDAKSAHPETKQHQTANIEELPRWSEIQLHSYVLLKSWLKGAF